MERHRGGRCKRKTTVDYKVYTRITEEENRAIEELCKKLGFVEKSAFVRMAIRDAIAKFQQRDFWDVLREQAK